MSPEQYKELKKYFRSIRAYVNQLSTNFENDFSDVSIGRNLSIVQCSASLLAKCVDIINYVDKEAITEKTQFIATMSEANSHLKHLDSQITELNTEFNKLLKKK